MTSFIEIEPMLSDYNGTSLRLGVTRYAVPDEMLGKLRAQQYFFPATQNLIGFQSYQGGTIGFNVTVRDGDVPQPEPIPVTTQMTETVVSVPEPEPVKVTLGPTGEGKSYLSKLLFTSIYGRDPS